MLQGLDLWTKLERTDPAATKRFDKGSFKGTAVDPVYNLKRVTEALGPVGFAWGWRIVKDELVKFEEGDEPTWIHTAIVRAWFRQEDGAVQEVEHVGQTIAARYVGRGQQRRFFVDDEYAKKSVTDALSKIMLSLGASADVWLGRFDGSKYAELTRGQGHEGKQASATEEPPSPGEQADEAMAREERPRPKPPGPDEYERLIKDAEGLIATLPEDNAEGVRAAQRWIKSAAGPGRPSRWAELGRVRPELREALTAAIVERAAELNLDLKGTAA